MFRLFLFIPLLYVISFGSDMIGKLPDEIRHFYEDFNYISSYSTQTERRALAYDQELPSKFKNDVSRISKIREKARMLDKYIEKSDPGCISGDKEETSVLLMTINGISKIISVHRNGNTIDVTVQVYPLSDEENLLRIDKFNKSQSGFLLDKRIHPAKNPLPSRIDHWRFESGSWLKNEVSLQQLYYAK